MGSSCILVTTTPHPLSESRKAFCVGEFSEAHGRPCVLSPGMLTDDIALRCCLVCPRWLSLTWTMLAPSPARPPLPPCSTDPLLPSAPWCGSLTELESKKNPRQPLGILMRPSPFHYVVISYFTALTVTAQEASEGLYASHTQR